MSLLGFPDCIPIDIDPCFDVVEGVEAHELDHEFDQVFDGTVLYDECHCIRCEVPFFLFPFPLG